MHFNEEEHWRFSFAFEHSWKIITTKRTSLSSIFRSHNENYEWHFSLIKPTMKPNRDEILTCNFCIRTTSYKQLLSCKNCNNRILGNDFFDDSDLHASKNFCLQMLQNFENKTLNNSEKKKVNIQILKKNIEGSSDENVKKELIIDIKDITNLTIPFEELEAEIFQNTSDLIITIKVFDILNQSMCSLQTLLKSGECSDFKIIIGKKEFLVHKCLLAAKSKYFSAMFKSVNQEQLKGFVNIVDVSEEVMSELLHYIYCEPMNLSQELLYELLTAADKYQIDSLKMLCENMITNKLTVQTLGNCIEYAEVYNNEYLKEAAFTLIMKKKKCGYKFSADEIKNLKSSLSLVSSSFSASLVCELLI